MPSAFSHAFVAIAIGSSSDRIRLFKILLIGSICAAIPDLDAIGFQMGIPYDSLFGHRGITHSFFFSFFLALLVMKLFFTNEIIKGKNGSDYSCIFFWQQHLILSLICSPMEDLEWLCLRLLAIIDISSRFAR